MKPNILNRFRITQLLAVTGLFAMSLGAHAASNTWLGNTNSTWDTTTNNWTSPTAWANGNDAVFGATGAGTLTVGAGVTAHNLDFTANGYTLQTGGLTLVTASATITTAPGISASISSAVGGTVGLIKNGTGTLTLSGVNGYSGGTAVADGKLVLASSGSVTVGNTADNVTAANGATLEIAGTLTMGGSGGLRTIGATAGTGTIDVKSTGIVNLNANSANLIIGQGSGSGHNGVMNVEGAVTVSGGTSDIYVGNNANTTGTLNVLSGGVLNFTGRATTGTFGFQIGRASTTATGIVNLETNGTIGTSRSILNGTGTGNFNFNGGTLKALATGASLNVTTTTVNSGGAIVDTNGFAAFTIADAMVAGTGTGTGGLTKNSTGTLTLSVANTFAGNTVVNGGALALGNNLSLQNSALDTTTGTGTVTLNAGVTTPTLGGLTGSTALASKITSGYTSVTALTLNPTTGSKTYSGEIANGAANMTLTKTGNGTQILSGANSYTGATNINNGTLLINGSTNVSSAFTVGASGTLGGTGTINGTVSVSGVLAPGAASVDTLDTGALTFANNSTFAYDLNSTSLGGDVLTSSSTLDLNTGTVNLTLNDISAGTLTVGDKLTLISYIGGWSPTELFTYGIGEIADDDTITVGANQFTFDYNDANPGTNGGIAGGGRSFVTMTVVPEPAAALLGSLGMLALLRRRRA
jgi:fibronectin-binding autotransporter adhesin